MPVYTIPLFWIFVGGLCAYLAKQKNRNIYLWFFIGLLFSLFGLIAIALLPSKTPAKEVANLSYSDSSAEATFPSDEDPIPQMSSKVLRIPTNRSLEWYYIDPLGELKIEGPFKLKELRKTYFEKKLSDQIYLWCEELDEWTPCHTFANASTIFDQALLEPEA